MNASKPSPILAHRQSACLTLLAAVVVAHASCTVAAAADPDPDRFAREIRSFELWDRKNTVPPEAVLFVGSSSIRMWNTADDFPHLLVVNRGFGGSHISDVNHFAERIVLRYQPRLIVLYAGDNDIASGKSPRRVFDDFQAFVAQVEERLPNVRTVYLAIKPSRARWRAWPRMQEANELIRQAAKENGRLTYVDTASPMLGDDGLPRSGLFLEDQLHLNAAGYRLWTEILSPQLQTER